MKKIFRSLLAIAIAATTFTACEDVPAPYDLPDSGSGNKEPDITAEAKGSGTLEDPFNAVAAINEAKKLASGAVSDNAYYIKGIVVSIATDKNGNVLNFDQGSFGNATFYISDDGTTTNQFYCYRVLYLGNKKWTQGAGDVLKVGDEVIVCAKLTMYNTTPETQQNEGYLYSLNGKSEGGGGSTETGTPSGTGVQSDPYNVAAVLNYINTLGSDVTSDKEVYIKGKITDITEEFSTDFGNATFIMSDEGVGNKFTAYRIKYLGNEKYQNGQTQIKVGDEVIVCGKVVNFRGNTPETAQNTAYLYSLNGETKGGSDTPDTPDTPVEAKGDGTLTNPFNAAAAIEYATSVGEGESDKEVYIKGKVSTIKNNYVADNYGNATFYISEDGNAANEFYCYRTLYLGNQKYTSGALLKQGDEVIICGKVTCYKGNTPETVQNKAYLYSLNGSTEAKADEGGNDNPSGGGEETADGYVISMSSFGLSNQADATTLTADDGTTLTFSKEDGKNAPKYYEAAGGAIRMYALNSLTITSSKTITKVVVTTTEPYQGTAYNGNDTMFGEADGKKVTMKKNSDTQVTFSDFSSKTLKIVNDHSSNSGGTQLRIMKITITYAD